MPPRKSSSAKPPKEDVSPSVSAVEPEVYFAYWPGDDDEIKAKEYFNADEAKKFKEAKGSKWPFTDPHGPLKLPPSLLPDGVDVAESSVTWLRPQEYFERFPAKSGETDTSSRDGHEAGSSSAVGEAAEPIMVSGTRQKIQETHRVCTPAELQWLRMKDMTYPARMTEVSSNFLKCNEHLLGSQLFATIIGHLTELQGVSDENAPHCTRIWENIWPQTKSGDAPAVPGYNTGGKYIVKLFWLHAWRRVVVDDLIPVAVDGRWLLPRSPLDNELWPTILSKAILKLASLGYHASRRCEFGDIDILSMLTGWPSRDVAIVHCAGGTHGYGAVVQALYDTCPALPQWEPVPNKKVVPDDQPVDQVSPAVEDLKPGKKDRKREKLSAGGASPEKATRSKSKPTSGVGGDAASPPAAAAPQSPATPLDRPTYAAASVVPRAGVGNKSAGPRLELGDGVREPAAHTVRVLECLYIPRVLHGADPDYNDVSNWIVQCQSVTCMLQGGELAYSNDAAWTTSLTQVARLSREYADNCNARSLAQVAEGGTYAPMTWHMRMSEFLNAFSSVKIYPKIDPDTTYVLEATSVQVAPHARMGIAPPTVAADPSVTPQPFFFCFDSLHPTQVVVSFSAAPSHMPLHSTNVPPDRDHASSASTLSVADEHGRLAVTAGTPTSGRAPDAARALQHKQGRHGSASGVVLEEFHWKSATKGEQRGALCTTGDAGTVLSLAAGKQLYRIILQHSGACSVAISAPRGFGGVSRIVIEQEAYEMLATESLRLKTHAVQIGKLIGLMVTDRSKWSVILQLIASMTTSPLKQLMAIDSNVDFSTKVSPGMATFWAAIISSLALSLKDEWCTNDGQLTPLAIAWTRLVVTWKLGAPADTAENRQSPEQSHSNPASSSASPPAARHESTAHSLSPDEACTVIQRAYRAYLSRKRAWELRAAAVTRDTDLVMASWERLNKNLCDFTVLLFRRMFELSPSLKWQLVWDDDEANRGFAQDQQLAEGSGSEKDAFEWFLLFKDTLQFTSHTTALLQLRLSATASVSLEQQRVLEDSLRLDVFDNSTQEYLPMAFNRPLVCDFEPTAAGYTVVACGQSAVPVPACSWVLRVLSYPAFPLAPEQPLPSALAPHVETGPVRVQTAPGSGVLVQQDDGATVVAYDVLFRYRVQVAADVVASVHLGVHPGEVPGAEMVLEVLENDAVCHTVRGAHSVYAPCVPLQASHTLAAAVRAADEADATVGKGSAKSGKGSAKGGKERKGSAKSAPGSTATSRPTTSSSARATPPVPVPGGTDHTYVLIGRMTKGVPTRPLVMENTDAGVRSAADRPGGKKKGKGKPETPSEPQWRLQIFGSSVEGEMAVQPVAPREEEIASIKMGWEAVNEGRADKAAVVRDTFLTAKDVDAAEHTGGTSGDDDPRETPAQDLDGDARTIPSSPTGVVRVFDEQLRMERETQRDAAHRAYRERAAARHEREQERQARHRAITTAHFTNLCANEQHKAQLRQNVLRLRSAYRQRLVDEDNAKKQLELARVHAQQAELHVREANDPSLAGGAGKKKKKK
eukprot:m.1281302 g.1281302  ORF g.1281302 m.1281302 type:complete len:1548 (-) comp24770_c0_seq1:193-4836(-)